MHEPEEKNIETVLLVDSDLSQLSILRQAISEKLPYKVFTANNIFEARAALLSDHVVKYSIMLIDMKMQNSECLDAIRSIKTTKPDFPIIIITEYGNQEHATMAINCGASDFLTKPLTIARLGLSISNALRICHLNKTIKELEQKLVADGVYTSPSNDLLNPLINPNIPLLDDGGKVKKLRTLEDDAIRFALEKCGGSMSKTARMLGIGRSTLYRKINDAGLQNGQ